MKKAFTLVMILSLVISSCLLTGCGLKDWKLAANDFISCEPDTFTYELIYLDSDRIPEIVVYGECEADGAAILYYNDGAIMMQQLARLGFQYIPKSGLLLNEDGNMGCYFDCVYELKNDEFTELGSGNFTEKDPNAEKPSYNYYWNDESVSKKEYEDSLADIFDKEKAVKSDFTKGKTKEEILKEIEKL